LNGKLVFRDQYTTGDEEVIRVSTERNSKKVYCSGGNGSIWILEISNF
jgi:hypothetical protein